MNPISIQANPLLFFQNPKALSKQLQLLGVSRKQWARLAKEFERKPLNLTLENGKFQMLDGASIVEKRDILKKPTLYSRILKPFLTRKYRERMENLAAGCFELMQNGSTLILDHQQILADQKARVDEWKKILPQPDMTFEEDLDTLLVASVFLGNLQSFLSIENCLAKIDLKFTGNTADRTLVLGRVLATIGLKTLQDCKDKGIQDNFTADRYLEQNKKNFKQLILKNHGSVIKAVG
jgi:hypothetical protein